MRKRYASLLFAGTLVVGTGIGGIVAHADDTPSEVIGCFDTSTGQLRVLTSDRPACDEKSETELHWNQSQVSQRWYRDSDGDGQGDWYSFVDSPAAPPGYAPNHLDCNDNNPNAYYKRVGDPGPGDLDCNGVEAQDRVVTWWRDLDGDGFAGPHSKTIQASIQAHPAGYVLRTGDCDDHAAKVHPYQLHCQHDGDVDGDGHRSVTAGGDDCNDSDPREYPGAAEVRDTTGHDEDCDPQTGAVIGYDPLFLDPRPHRYSFLDQLMVNAHGHVVQPEVITIPVSDQRWATPPSLG